MNEIKIMEAGTTEEIIGAYVDELAGQKGGSLELVPLLKENHPLYKDRSTNQAIRIKGYILSKFELCGLSETALPIVLEELQSGHSSYLIAAAAKALRGSGKVSAKFSKYLDAAYKNIRYADDAISFESISLEWPLKNPTTAVEEISKTRKWLDIQLASLKNSSCCDGTIDRFENLSVLKKPVDLKKLKNMIMEDQDGNSISFGEFFSGKPSIVAFFYTRCNNPAKCSLTVTRMAYLQQLIRSENLSQKVNIALVSYDPEYDTAEKMRSYSSNRGFEFDSNCKALRTDPELFDSVKDYFTLNVNYSPVIVNQHSIEFFLLDSKGRINASQKRIQWNDENVIKQVKQLTRKFSPLAFLGSVWAPFVSILIAFFPKCPICWAAYMSMFGISGLTTLRYTPWLKYVFIGLLAINIAVITWRAVKRNYYIPLVFCLLGVLIMISSMGFEPWKPGVYSGAALIFIGSLLNSLSIRILSSPNPSILS